MCPQIWYYSENEELRLKDGENNRRCLDVALFGRHSTSQVRLMKCHNDKAGQQWIYFKVKYRFGSADYIGFQCSVFFWNHENVDLRKN